MREGWGLWEALLEPRGASVRRKELDTIVILSLAQHYSVTRRFLTDCPLSPQKQVGPVTSAHTGTKRGWVMQEGGQGPRFFSNPEFPVLLLEFRFLICQVRGRIMDLKPMPVLRVSDSLTQDPSQLERYMVLWAELCPPKFIC